MVLGGLGEEELGNNSFFQMRALFHIYLSGLEDVDVSLWGPPFKPLQVVIEFQTTLSGLLAILPSGTCWATEANSPAERKLAPSGCGKPTLR